MLIITQDAARAIAGVLEQEPDNAGLRIVGGTHSLNGQGPALHMELAPAPEAEDEVIEDEGVRLFIAEGTAPALDGKVLDVEVEGDEVRFSLLEAG